LDITSREIVEKAVHDFPGALLLISHDKYFVEQVGVNKIYEIKNQRLVKIAG